MIRDQLIRTMGGIRLSPAQTLKLAWLARERKVSPEQVLSDIVPGMIVFERWLPGESLRMRIHGRKVESAKVSAPGTGAGDLPVSDAVRGESLVGRPITPMG